MFVVQEHHASRLHYDFRLEIGGVLKSWAIPKGPSMNPLEKRLAVMVDDHPLEYGSFEGIIPSGHYGAGAVVLWDRGTFELVKDRDAAAALGCGSLTVALRGQRLRGAFALVKLKGPRATGKEWLLIKQDDQDADPRFILTTALTASKRKRLTETIPPCDVVVS